MKKYMLFVLALTCTNLIAVAQNVPNGGFENWSMPNGYNVPDNWSTLNDLTSPLNVYTCTKGTPGSPGSSFIKLTSKSVAGIGVVPGIAVSGQLNTSSFSALSGFPFAFHPTSFTGKWQYMGATSNDIGSVSVVLTHFDSALGMRDTVAVATKLLTGMEMSWVNFSMPITYLNSNLADSCIIFLNSSGANPQVSSYLYVDNLAFTIPTEIQEMHESAGLSCFPNPAENVLNVSWKETPATAVKLKVYNSLGQSLSEGNYPPNKNLILDTSNYPSGCYFLQVYANGEKSIIQFYVK